MIGVLQLSRDPCIESLLDFSVYWYANVSRITFFVA